MSEGVYVRALGDMSYSSEVTSPKKWKYIVMVIFLNVQIDKYTAIYHGSLF